MPPRVPASRLVKPVQCRCSAPQTSAESRGFHASTQHSIRQGFDASTEPSIRHRPLSIANSRTRQRKDMLEWFDKVGSKLRDPLPGSTNYLNAYDFDGNLKRAKYSESEDKPLPEERPGDLQPYPSNSNFRSQPVLSEELRDQIYGLVVEEGKNIEDVAASYRVDVRRVAAVVRLKSVEQQWLQEGKKLVKPYAKAVMSMLPQTPLRLDNKIDTHESINDLPVHSSTRQQLFYPVSESRKFTREDAAKAFADNLLPADKRIPLPQLIKSERMINANTPREERLRILREDYVRDAAIKAGKEAKRKEWEQRTQRVVSTRRWDFKFQDIGAQNVNDNGRSQTAVGARYGWPHEDRKRGMVKIPTRVE